MITDQELARLDPVCSPEETAREEDEKFLLEMVAEATAKREREDRIKKILKDTVLEEIFKLFPEKRSMIIFNQAHEKKVKE